MRKHDIRCHAKLDHDNKDARLSAHFTVNHNMQMSWKFSLGLGHCHLRSRGIRLPLSLYHGMSPLASKTISTSPEKPRPRVWAQTLPNRRSSSTCALPLEGITKRFEKEGSGSGKC